MCKYSYQYSILYILIKLTINIVDWISLLIHSGQKIFPLDYNQVTTLLIQMFADKLYEIPVYILNQFQTGSFKLNVSQIVTVMARCIKVLFVFIVLWVMWIVWFGSVGNIFQALDSHFAFIVVILVVSSSIVGRGIVGWSMVGWSMMGCGMVKRGMVERGMVGWSTMSHWV